MLRVQKHKWSFLALMSFIFLATLMHLFSDHQSNLKKDEASQQQFSSTVKTLRANPRSAHYLKPKAVPTQEGESTVLINDPDLKHKWGLSLTESELAWNISKGSRDIVVAVIDTGIDANHPDLRNNLWVNKGETGTDKWGRPKSSNGIDDDGNGYIDDVHGYNFVENNNDLTDNHGHGTHIAGIIGAEGGNGIGISGVSPKVSLMILKYYDPKVAGNDNLKNTIRAIEYAAQMNAKIINYSGGGTEASSAEKAAIQLARQKNILFVAASGNERSNSDVAKYFPADYELDNIISVTAINKSNQVLPSSNYGTHTVDIAAPGNEIYSTIPGGGYGRMTGTSQATAFVTGVAALIMANNKELNTPIAVAKFINKTGTLDENLENKTRYKRRLNTYRALAMLDQGMSLNGVIAVNTAHSITSYPTAEEYNFDSGRIPSAVNMSAFGKILERQLKKQSTSKQASSKNNLNPLAN